MMPNIIFFHFSLNKIYSLFAAHLAYIRILVRSTFVADGTNELGCIIVVHAPRDFLIVDVVEQ